MTLQPCTKLGPFEIASQLGSGGMGTVYKARDPKLQRMVAIKVLATQDEGASARLLQEARAASALSHPNVATVHEVDEHDGRPYIVMELVEGTPLSELIPADGLPPESVIRYGLQIADALAHAHEKGIIHRDLKSQNVVITPEGRAKVLDFGLATRLEQHDAEAVTVSMDTRADVGRIAGTLAYMAPEVLRGEEATARSDIWAMGVLLYEMVRGRLPFGGATRTDVVSAIVTQSPSSLPAKVSAGLKAIIQRCLSKEPGHRYVAAAAVQAALEAIQSDSSVQPTDLAPTRVARPSSRMAAAAVGLVFVAGGIGYWLRPVPEQAMTRSNAVLELTSPAQLTRAVGEETNPAWSPDGEMLAYESNQDGNWDIWVTQPSSAQAVNRTENPESADFAPAWSPDGSQLAFLSARDGDRGVFVMSAVGGPPRKLGTFSGGFRSWSQIELEWLADGTALATKVGGGDWPLSGDYSVQDVFVEILTVATGDTQRVPLPGRTADRHDLRWSHDKQYLAYVDTSSPRNQSTQLWVLRVEDGEATTITDTVTRDLSPSWSPDSRMLFYVSDRGGSLDLWQQPMSDGFPLGEPARVTVGVGMQRAVFSPDGTKLAYTRGGFVSNLWRLPIRPDRAATWSAAEQLTFDEANVEMVGISPDGNSVVISSDRGGNPDLWLLPASGGELQQLTTDPAPDFGGNWSPDGRQIAFYSVRSGNRDVWVIPAAGGVAIQLTTDDGDDRAPSWSPDGTEIVFSSPRSGHNELWVISAEGGEPRQLTDSARPHWGPVWSPGGTWILFYGQGRVWRLPASGGDANDLTSGSNPRWSSDGEDFYFVSAKSGQSEIWVRSHPSGEERQVSELLGRPGRLGGNSFATDGHGYVYFGWGLDSGDIWVMDVVQDELY